MRRILVAYATNAGSTIEVAQAIGEELGRNGAHVQVRQIRDVTAVDDYDAVVVGAPMIMGWHRSAVSFVKKHQQELSELPVAYFLTAGSLTHPDHQNLEAPIFIDPGLAKPPQNAGRLSFKERHTTVNSYLQPVLKNAPLVKPISIGFFGGKIDVSRLSWWQKLFVLVIIRAQLGDFRNWPFIRQWASNLIPILR